MSIPPTVFALGIELLKIINEKHTIATTISLVLVVRIEPSKGYPLAPANGPLTALWRVNLVQHRRLTRSSNDFLSKVIDKILFLANKPYGETRARKAELTQRMA